MNEDDQPKEYPAGIFGFLAQLRDFGLISGLPGGWVKVFVALYSRRNERGYAWPSQASLAKDAGVDKRTVRRFIRWAKIALGMRVVRTQHNTYYLPLDEKIDPFLGDRALPGKRRCWQAEKRTTEHPQRTGDGKSARDRKISPERTRVSCYTDQKVSRCPLKEDTPTPQKNFHGRSSI